MPLLPVVLKTEDSRDVFLSMPGRPKVESVWTSFECAAAPLLCTLFESLSVAYFLFITKSFLVSCLYSRSLFILLLVNQNISFAFRFSQDVRLSQRNLQTQSRNRRTKSRRLEELEFEEPLLQQRRPGQPRPLPHFYHPSGMV